MRRDRHSAIPVTVLWAAGVIPALAVTRLASFPGTRAQSAPVESRNFVPYSNVFPAEGSAGLDDQQAVAVLSREIAGNENKPASQVYKNVTVFRQMPAGQLLLVMNAFSRALGTDCAHCHEAGTWESESKPEKQIAREMFNMVVAINQSYLKNIKGLKSANPTVSCTTCHRGRLKPEITLPESSSGKSS